MRCMTKLFLGLVAVIVLCAGLIYFADAVQPPGESVATSTGVAATTTPTSTATSTATTTLVRVETRINQGASALDVTVTPRELLEDSRCPIGVQCIWAGRVRVAVDISSGLGTAHETYEIGTMITTEAEAVTLVEVAPSPRADIERTPSDYTFIFEIEKRDINAINPR